MVSGKYASDYRLENVADRKGRLRTVPVYRGSFYSFVSTASETAVSRRVFAVSTAVEWLLYFAALLINSGAGRTAYVSLPFLALAFPLLGQTDAVWTYCRAEGAVIRSVKDKISEKTVSWVFMVLFFSVASICGHVAYWLKGRESLYDAAFLVLTVVMSAVAWNLFRRRGDLRMGRAEI